jgi:diguanylate cyclase (GGDEF)-like protein
MATVLLVDDNDLIRKVVAAILSQEGHTAVEAADGAQALLLAHAERPDVVISDILMPSMDGFEFVRQLRADAALTDVPVIFHTAHYHEQEARQLAEKCQVATVLPKPCDASRLLRAVKDALRDAPPTVGVPAPEFDRQHLRLLTDKLSRQTEQLTSANARLAALTELNLQLASERDLHALLRKVCRGARELLGSRYAVLAVRERTGSEATFSCTSGIDNSTRSITAPRLDAGRLGKVLAERLHWRASDCPGPEAAGLPEDYPSAEAFIAVPLSSPTHTYGWLCVADKVGAKEFDAEDERILAILGAQSGRVYENGSLYHEVQRHAAQLSNEIRERERLNRVYAMLSDINALIVRARTRDELCRDACRLAAEHGRFDLAVIALLDDTRRRMDPFAWSGDGSDLFATADVQVTASGSASRMLVTALNSQRPAICNELEVDSGAFRGNDELLARGYRAVCVLPLVIEGRSEGCIAFATREFGFFDEPEIKLLVGLASDVSFGLDHIDKSERLSYLALYDSLTGLANRTLFLERLSAYLEAAAQTQQSVAVLLLEFDRLDTVDKTLGRGAVDELLRQFAERAKRAERDCGQIARVGPHMFAAVLTEAGEAGEILFTLERWRRMWLNHPFRIGESELTLTAKSGIAIYPQDGSHADELLRNSEAALRKGRGTGNGTLFYTPHLSEHLAEQLALEHKLRHALENEEFVLHYQPIVDLASREWRKVEALIRWRSPERGLVPPLEFIPLLEESGLIVEVGLWALRQAHQDLLRWRKNGYGITRVAVNVSTVQLRRPDFVGELFAILGPTNEDHGIDVEVTESVIMDDVDNNIEKLRALRPLGVGVAIDDFGTGYSSLSYLARLPVQTLKIDRSFIGEMLDEPDGTTLVSTIISLGHALRMTVVAEGVESDEQAKMLRLLRCDRMQGFLIGRPRSASDTEACLSKSSL